MLKEVYLLCENRTFESFTLKSSYCIQLQNLGQLVENFFQGFRVLEDIVEIYEYYTFNKSSKKFFIRR